MWGSGHQAAREPSRLTLFPRRSSLLTGHHHCSRPGGWGVSLPRPLEPGLASDQTEATLCDFQAWVIEEAQSSPPPPPDAHSGTHGHALQKPRPHREATHGCPSRAPAPATRKGRTAGTRPPRGAAAAVPERAQWEPVSPWTVGHLSHSPSRQGRQDSHVDAQGVYLF